MPDICACCGAIVPEGLIACPNCLVVSMQNNHVDEIDFDYAAEDDNA